MCRANKEVLNDSLYYANCDRSTARVYVLVQEVKWTEITCSNEIGVQMTRTFIHCVDFLLEHYHWFCKHKETLVSW